MARFQKPSNQNKVRFTDKVKQQDRKPSTAEKGISRFLQSFTSRLSNLSQSAKSQLSEQTPNQQSTMQVQAVNKIIASTKKDLLSSLDQFSKDKIDKQTLRNQLQQTLKKQAIATAIVGVQGVGNLTENVLTAVQRQLSVQFAYIDGFLEELDARPVNNKDKTRITRYAGNAWAMMQVANRQYTLDTSGVSATQLEERRKLGGSGQCDDCIELADNWQPFGTLPVPGTGTVCGDHCRCTMETRPIIDETAKVTSENPVIQDG